MNKEVEQLMDNSAIEKLIENEKEWRRHLVKEVDVVKVTQISQGKAFASLRTEFKIKSGVWGLIGGILPTVGLILVMIFKKIF